MVTQSPTTLGARVVAEHRLSLGTIWDSPSCSCGERPEDYWVHLAEQMDLASREAMAVLRKQVREAKHVSATHLFDGEALGERESIRNELLEMGWEAMRLVQEMADIEDFRASDAYRDDDSPQSVARADLRTQWLREDVRAMVNGEERPQRERPQWL